MNSVWRFGMIFAVIFSFLSSAASMAAPHSHAYRLFFPHLALNQDEQIEGFKVVIPCGHIESIVGIPPDWNIEVTRAISEVEELHASAGHGASYVRQMDEFNGVIRVVSTSDDCFTVSSEITVVFDNERVIKLSRKELTLKQSGT
ncbi:hypothetical protein [Dyella sp. 2HG41-7]|uniref:hypothetical protein n=1 Tax=Dyella sp. 2HG41-7 TaxID=2883239 RepID=UPI001F3E4DA4|nr:hypothetical protein [Dyella sp. 2HG41-7]